MPKNALVPIINRLHFMHDELSIPRLKMIELTIPRKCFHSEIKPALLSESVFKCKTISLSNRFEEIRCTLIMSDLHTIIGQP